MNVKAKLFWLSLAALLAMSACISGKKSLARGDYKEAVLQAVNRLRNNPGNRKAQETLLHAYPELVAYNLDRIAISKRGGNALRWEKIMDLYRELNEVYDEIQRSPSARSVIPDPGNYTSEYEKARVEAAKEQYALGERALALARQGDRQPAKRAYGHYRQANRHSLGFRDSEDKMAEARELAMLYVAVEPIPMHSNTLSLSNEFFQNQIMEYLRNGGFSPFVEFYSVAEAGQMEREPDHIIRMVFDDFVVGQALIKETVEQRLSDTIVIGQVTVEEQDNEVEKDVLGTVKAELHTFEKIIESGGLLDLQITDGRSRGIILQEKFPGTFIWAHKWGYFNGDERALNGEDKRLIKNRADLAPPLPQDLFIGFTRPIHRRLTRFVRDFYKDF